MGTERALAMFADWTDRIAAGELPPAPPRPQGLERNVVITQWDWADPKAYLHDEVSTDRRNPTLNANGLIYGSLELSADYLPVLDPVRTRDQAGEADGPRSEHAAHAGRRCRSRRRTGARRRSGPAATTSTTRCSTRRGACGSRQRCGRRPNPDFCREGSSASVGEAVSAQSARAAPRDVRPEDADRSRTSAPASARTT